MKVNETGFLRFLKNSGQFTVPPYQRPYCWTERECRRLWDDVLWAGEHAEITTHFLGAIVYVEQECSQISASTPHVVIDGQQRLATLTLLIEALARTLGDMVPREGFSAEQLRHYYMVDPLAVPQRRFRLLLTAGDRDTLLALIQQTEPSPGGSSRITENFAFFQRRLRSLAPAIPALCEGLEKLGIVDVALQRGVDQPQRIFESLNATGRGLLQADLIRNRLLMDLPSEEQERVYFTYLRPVEIGFHEDNGKFDRFMRHYMTLTTGSAPARDRIYEAFRDHANAFEAQCGTIETMACDIRRRAGHFRAMVQEEEYDPVLARAFRAMDRLPVEPAFPFLLKLYADWEESRLSREDFVAILQIVAGYLTRRSVCGLPGQVHKSVFANLARDLENEPHLESVTARFLWLDQASRHPGDVEFTSALMTRDLYSHQHARYILETLENHGRRERLPRDEYTIEHILPQSRNLSLAWQTELGADWQKVRDVWVHTLGNLTLSASNSVIGDKPFAMKRDMPGGYGESPLRLNEGLRDIPCWNEAAIRERGRRLADRALDVWPLPCLADEVLARYRKRAGRDGGPGWARHPQVLPGGPMHDLFEAVRGAILEIDPMITESPFTHYIAYKARTNVVDIVPQKARLLLVLNIGFEALDDPAGVVHDITGRKFWGNGDAQVAVDDRRQIPYAMSLVRQVLKKQMADGIRDNVVHI